MQMSKVPIISGYAEYFSRNLLAENINHRKNITADGLFRKNGTTTI
jgi:hypothetical protein